MEGVVRFVYPPNMSSTITGTATTLNRSRRTLHVPDAIAPQRRLDAVERPRDHAARVEPQDDAEALRRVGDGLRLPRVLRELLAVVEVG